MKFMLLIMNGDSQNASPTEPDYPAIFAHFDKLTGELKAQGGFCIPPVCGRLRRPKL